MQKKIVVLFMLMIAALILNSSITWHDNIENALQKAKAENKLVFVFFTGSDWCSWCDKLTEEVFDHQEFQNYVNDNMVMVKLDFPRAEILSPEQKQYNNQKQMQYNIQGYPSVIILDALGSVKVQTGYREGGPEKYVQFLEESVNWQMDDSNATWIDDQGLVWQKNLENALEIAKKDNKFIFVNFTGSDWCVWCTRLTDEVFSKPEFVDFSQNNLVLVRFDFPKKKSIPAGEENYNMQKAQQFGVRGFPTLFLLDQQGDIVQKLGYQQGGAVPYTDMLQDLIDNHK
jgi:protein disulfide-isomerase